MSSSRERPDAGPQQPGGSQAPVQVDDASARVAYANFCRVTATPEEVIIDFGLNPQAFTGQNQKVEVSERIVVNHYVAKRMAHLLQMTIHRHEQVFGPLELDVQKRALPGALGPGPQSGAH